MNSSNSMNPSNSSNSSNPMNSITAAPQHFSSSLPPTSNGYPVTRNP
jgi:hypothetical protein